MLGFFDKYVFRAEVHSYISTGVMAATVACPGRTYITAVQVSTPVGKVTSTL